MSHGLLMRSVNVTTKNKTFNLRHYSIPVKSNVITAENLLPDALHPTELTS